MRVLMLRHKILIVFGLGLKAELQDVRSVLRTLQSSIIILIISPSPFSAATNIGVLPFVVITLTAAPACISSEAAQQCP
jgi:hypothetical protein